MQHSSHSSIRAVGWLGCRTAAIVGVVCGIPLLIYSLAKVLFAKLLNAAALQRFETLNFFEEHSELQFTVFLITVSTLPMIIFALPALFMTAYGVYQGYQKFQ